MTLIANLRAGPHFRTAMKPRIWHVIGLITLLALGACKWLLHDLDRKEEGRGVKSVDWLPKEASNITYFRSAWHDEAIFEISESGFINFLATKKFKPNEITETKSIRLYSIEKTGNEGKMSDEELERLYHKIDHGLFFEEIHRNGGGWTFAYDRKNHLAYYLWSHH